MRFFVLPTGMRVPTSATPSSAYLLTDQWDDWFKYNTLYNLVVVTEQGQQLIGGVKIGQFDMRDKQTRPDIPDAFQELTSGFFSLGQDDSYYESLNALGDEVRDAVLAALQDVAVNEDLFGRSLKESVTGVSLLRSVTVESVRGQFRRLARGGARLSPYDFAYTMSRFTKSVREPPLLSFVVQPESLPPTNVHVVIGRNGAGKTHLLDCMARALAEPGAQPHDVGHFSGKGNAAPRFANLVSVTFSAFDRFEPLPPHGPGGLAAARWRADRGGTTAR